MMRDPEIVSEITLQPVRRLQVDAAILYSDILMVPLAMGAELHFVRGEGPVFPHPIRTESDIDQLGDQVREGCPFVFQAIKKIKREIPDLPLLGFAGGPFTVAAYWVGGTGAQEGNPLKSWAYQNPKLFHNLMEKLTLATESYLLGQIEAGVDAIQLFDTWAGILGEAEYTTWVLPYQKRIFQKLRSTGIPTILYVKGGGGLFQKMVESGAEVISIDSLLPLSTARDLAKGRVAIQGNLDPEKLFQPIPAIQKSVREMFEDWGKGSGYLVNLGHGIEKETPVEQALAFVEAAKKFGPGTVA